MAVNFIPSPNGDFRAWLTGFVAALVANPTDYNITAAEAAAISAEMLTYETADHAVTAAEGAFHAAVDTRAGSRNVVETHARAIARTAQAHTGITDATLLVAGLPVHKKTRTPVAAPTGTPVLYVDFSRRGEHTIHWGTNPLNEQLNKKEEGVDHLELRMKAGPAPVSPEEMQYVSGPTSSPFRVTLNAFVGQTVYWAGRYVNTRGLTGPWSDIVPGQVTA